MLDNSAEFRAKYEVIHTHTRTDVYVSYITCQLHTWAAETSLSVGLFCSQ